MRYLSAAIPHSEKMEHCIKVVVRNAVNSQTAFESGQDNVAVDRIQKGRTRVPTRMSVTARLRMKMEDAENLEDVL